MNNKQLAETAKISVVKRTLIGAAVMALSVAALAVPAEAGNNFVNVIANAECVVDGTDVRVDASLLQSDVEGPDTYEVAEVTYFLEEGQRKNKYALIDGSIVYESLVDGAEVPASIPAVDPGESVDVSSHLYEDICTLFDIDPEANSLRAVVEVEVSNSNPKRKNGQIHTGRCVSFANPCRVD